MRVLKKSCTCHWLSKHNFVHLNLQYTVSVYGVQILFLDFLIFTRDKKNDKPFSRKYNNRPWFI